MRRYGVDVLIYIDSQDETKVCVHLFVLIQSSWELLSKAQTKKMKTYYQEEKRKV